MDWKYTNEPDGKTCLAMNEGRCSWHRGKAIGHNGSKAFLKSQYQMLKFHYFELFMGYNHQYRTPHILDFKFFLPIQIVLVKIIDHWLFCFFKKQTWKMGISKLVLGDWTTYLEFYAFQKTVTEILKDVILFTVFPHIVSSLE